VVGLSVFSQCWFLIPVTVLHSLHVSPPLRKKEPGDGRQSQENVRLKHVSLAHTANKCFHVNHQQRQDSYDGVKFPHSPFVGPGGNRKRLNVVPLPRKNQGALSTNSKISRQATRSLYRPTSPTQLPTVLNQLLSQKLNPTQMNLI